MNIFYLYAYIWVTIFACLSAGPVPQRNRRISYGLKLQNKPRRNAIKTMPTTTTATSTTTSTTTADLKIQNTSFQSLDDYLNYDYDYMNYFYDLNYDDATAVEGKNKQRIGEIRSEPPNLKKVIPIESLSFKEEFKSGPLSFKDENPSEQLVFKEEVPNQSLSYKDEIRSEPPNLKKVTPIESLSFNEEFPSEPLTFKDEISSELLGFKEEVRNQSLNYKYEIPSEPATIIEELSSQVEKANGENFASRSETFKEEILNEPRKLKASSNIDLLKEIKVNRRNVTSNDGNTLSEKEKQFQTEEKSLSERKTPEEAIHTSQEKNSVLDEVKSLPDGRKTLLHKVVKAKIEDAESLLKEENPLTERQKDLFETEKIVPEEKIILPEGQQRKSLPEKKKFELAESDTSPLRPGISTEKVIERQSIKIEKEDKIINKINIIIRKPVISNVENKKAKLNAVKVLRNATIQGREGRLLDHDTLLQKIKILSQKESDGSNSKNETVLEEIPNGKKQLRYTTQQPDMAKSASKSSLHRIHGKQTYSSDHSRPEDIVKVVSEKTASVDAPIVGQIFMNNSKLGWRSESSVSVEVSVESSRGRGKEISSMPFHKIIVNGPERAQESMQLKEQLSLEVSATPKITDILPTFRPRITEANVHKNPLITSEHTTEREITTMKPTLTNSTTENSVTASENKPTITSSTSTFNTSAVESPTLKISQNGSNFPLPKNSSAKRTLFYEFESTNTSSFPPTTIPKSTSTLPSITPSSTDIINNERKTMKHSTIEKIATTDSMTVTQATITSETSTVKTSFVTEEPTITTSRYNGLPKKRQSRPFRRNPTFQTRKLSAPNENSPHLIAQLGMNPHGIHPSGVNPFGMQPQGISPFGVSPNGIDPLGLRSQMLNVTNDNNTLVERQNTTMTNETNTELKPDPVAEERVHVQVTKPDGSINGDYLVLDHNTGSLSGVRYEAIDGADQALIQKALLSFLSLDPRLDPRPKDMNGVNLPESIIYGEVSPEIPAFVDAVQPSSDPSTNTESTTSVKLKPQLTNQT